MLYPKSAEKKLTQEQFRHPGSEYRGAPFWAWNCRLEKEELLRQLEVLKKMGLGGRSYACAHRHGHALSERRAYGADQGLRGKMPGRKNAGLVVRRGSLALRARRRAF